MKTLSLSDAAVPGPPRTEAASTAANRCLICIIVPRCGIAGRKKRAFLLERMITRSRALVQQQLAGERDERRQDIRGFGDGGAQNASRIRSGRGPAEQVTLELVVSHADEQS